MLGHKRIPSREGGVEIVVEELASRMSQLGYDVTCYNRKGKHVMDKSIEKNHLSEYKGVHLKSVLTIDKKGLSAMSSSFFASIQAAFSNVCPKAKNGVLTPIIYIFYSKNSFKTAI